MSDNGTHRQELEVENGKLAEMAKAIGILRRSCGSVETPDRSDRIMIAVADHLEAEVNHFRDTRMKFACVNVLVALGDDVEKFSIQMGHSTLDEAWHVAQAILDNTTTSEGDE